MQQPWRIEPEHQMSMPPLVVGLKHTNAPGHPSGSIGFGFGSWRCGHTVYSWFISWKHSLKSLLLSSEGSTSTLFYCKFNIFRHNCPFSDTQNISPSDIDYDIFNVLAVLLIEIWLLLSIRSQNSSEPDFTSKTLQKGIIWSWSISNPSEINRTMYSGWLLHGHCNTSITFKHLIMFLVQHLTQIVAPLFSISQKSPSFAALTCLSNPGVARWWSKAFHQFF